VEQETREITFEVFLAELRNKTKCFFWGGMHPDVSTLVVTANRVTSTFHKVC